MGLNARIAPRPPNLSTCTSTEYSNVKHSHSPLVVVKVGQEAHLKIWKCQSVRELSRAHQITKEEFSKGGPMNYKESGLTFAVYMLDRERRLCRLYRVNTL